MYFSIHLSKAAFCSVKFQWWKTDALLTVLESIPANHCFFRKSDAQYIISCPEYQNFKIISELSLLGEQIVLLQFNFESKSSKTFGPEAAYCIATSGSTGPPKLVRVPTQCILPNLLALEKLLNVHETDRILMSCPPTFDPFVVDVFLALRNGACLVLVENELRLDAGRLRRVVFERSEVTVMQITPSLLRQWSDEAIRDVLLGRGSSLRHLILGGEPFPSWLSIPSESVVKVYNIYGITEVSCWASIELVGAETGGSNVGTSLGSPLDDLTVFQLRDVDTGEVLDLESTAKPVRGNLHIGSSVRKCVIGDEPPGDVLRSEAICYRSTGDLVELQSDGKFYYLGRGDETVKRLGIRVNLGWLERCADQCAAVSKSCAIFDPVGHRIALFYISGGNVQENDIRMFLEDKLMAEEMPDDLIEVKELLLSDHGKVNRKKCLEQLQIKVITPRINLKDLFSREISKLLGVHVQSSETLNSKRAKFDIEGSFIDAGGTSIQALQISTSLQDCSKTCIPNLIGMLLDKSIPLKDVLKYLEGLPHEAPPSSPQPTTSEQTQPLSTKIVVQSRFNMDKCIDASPTEFHSVKHNLRIVAVGSHSHKLLVVDIDTNQIVTQLILPDRIESAVSYRGDEGLVGCYDGLLYCFDLWTGTIRWSFDSGGMIKCRALVEESVIIFGSYATEHNLFALDMNGALMWKSRLGSKGILSSPISVGPGRAFVATLDGSYCCFNTASGSAVEWEGKLPTPVFANATFLQQFDAVLVAEVQGTLHCLSGECGSKLWQISSEGNVFSSPQVLYPDNGRTAEILFGCHDKHLYCYSWTGKCSESPVQKWKLPLQSPIYATPCIANGLAVVCSTSGWVNLVCLLSGEIIGLLKLGGEVFSSPLVVGQNVIYVGCRDNNLYKLAFTR
ncbi:beta-alanine-activating enzyme isoform X2 [Aedes albopictus]|uniref:AMP-dependent synthetase/ligase domain-containing protein n=1 Tax=Aedes albopictus TaxID=7160 RepID=A0ABM1Z9E8_AEDAL